MAAARSSPPHTGPAVTLRAQTCLLLPRLALTQTAMSVFNAANPNGTWSLFVADHSGGDVGDIAGGWSLSLTMISPVNQLADLVLNEPQRLVLCLRVAP